jgi:LacI family transcriptional regulator
VAVVGYDDEPIASIADPPLTTVKVNKARMASLAVQVLNERLENHTEGRYRHLRVRPTLVVRESCGGRPARTAASAAASIHNKKKMSSVS